MQYETMGKPIEILLVEDNAADADLTESVMKSAKVRNNMSVVTDGEAAISFLRRLGDHHAAPRPDLILLDLNLPKKNGQEVLAELQSDDDLKHIPVVILTTSQDEHDVMKSYQLGANCFVTKPVGLAEFRDVVRSIDDFWFTVVKLPSP